MMTATEARGQSVAAGAVGSSPRTLTGPAAWFVLGAAFLTLGLIATWNLHSAAAVVVVVLLGVVFAATAMQRDFAMLRVQAPSDGSAGQSVVERAQFEQERAQAEREIEGAIRELAVRTSDGDTAVAAEGIEPAVVRRLDALADMRRRDHIERLLASAVEWGHVTASSFTSPPRPQIQWTENGEPTILFGSADTPRPATVVGSRRGELDLWGRDRLANGGRDARVETHPIAEHLASLDPVRLAD